VIARRRFLVVVMGGLVAWPLVAGAQSPTMPIVGVLSSLSASDRSRIVLAFLQGLSEAGYVEGRNLAIEYRWAEDHYDRRPALANDLVRRHVVAIAALSGTPAGLAAKAATATIPIVFAVGGDPVAHGLVGSLSRPSGNVTDVTFFTAQLATKRLASCMSLSRRRRRLACS
jgi:putative ABC transport system substrate-binding protein